MLTKEHAEDARAILDQSHQHCDWAIQQFNDCSDGQTIEFA